MLYLFTLLDKPYSPNIKAHWSIEFQGITTTGNFSGPTKSSKSRKLRSYLEIHVIKLGRTHHKIDMITCPWEIRTIKLLLWRHIIHAKVITFRMAIAHQLKTSTRVAYHIHWLNFIHIIPAINNLILVKLFFFFKK